MLSTKSSLAYNKTLLHPDLRAVNLGSVDDPKWYAPEDLKIVPYQIFKSVCPTTLAESMLTNANHQPWDSAALVEIEALHALGINNSHQTPMALVSINCSDGFLLRDADLNCSPIAPCLPSTRV